MVVVLQVATVGRDDDFFLLGGDSLRGMQLIAHLKTIFGVDLSIQSLFGEAATVAGMARAIEAIRAGARGRWRYRAGHPAARFRRDPAPTQRVVRPFSRIRNCVCGFWRGSIRIAGLQRNGSTSVNWIDRRSACTRACAICPAARNPADHVCARRRRAATDCAGDSARGFPVSRSGATPRWSRKGAADV